MSELKRIPRASDFDELRHFTMDRNVPPALEVEVGVTIDRAFELNRHIVFDIINTYDG